MADADPKIQPGFQGVVGPTIVAEDLNGKQVRTVVPGFVPLSANGQVAGTSGNPTIVQDNQVNYQLATATSLANGANTTPVTGVLSGAYVWNVVGTFSGGSTVILEALGSDGATYQTVDTATAPGSRGVTMGSNATVRLKGGVATTTGLSSNLS